jgi:rhodanese-related sulfurtransferase
MNSITNHELAQLQTEGQALTLLDVRRDKARQSDGTQIAHAQWQDPALWLEWKDQIPKDLPVVLYCAHGREISQGLTTALQVMGLNALFLEGGIAAWYAESLATEAVA